jgi:hypothetical protein
MASSGRHYFRVVVVVFINDLSNKQLHLNRNPLISCRVTWIQDDSIIQFVENARDVRQADGSTAFIVAAEKGRELNYVLLV